MGRIVSIHEYELRSAVQGYEFELAIENARNRGLLQLPGLIDFYIMKGLRGARKGRYAAIWIYESKQAWEKLWGPVDQPLMKEEYPSNWRTWEGEVLAPLLASDPDKITYTAYEVI